MGGLLLFIIFQFLALHDSVSGDAVVSLVSVIHVHILKRAIS